MKRITPFVIAVALALTSCHNTKKIVKRYTLLDTINVTASRVSNNNIYRASAQRVWDITNTKASLSFNWQEKTAAAKCVITLHPYFYPTDTLVLDAKSMRIDSVLLENGDKLNYTYKDDLLKISFNKTYNNTDTIALKVVYLAMPYATSTGGSIAITEDRGLYFINTDHAVPGKPSQIWTQGETESNSHWLPTIDKPNTRLTTEIELMVPDTMQSLSNGSLIKSYRLKNNMRCDVWKMDKPIQVYAVMFAIGRFNIVKDQWRGKEVNYYVEPAYTRYAKKMFNNTPEMMEYFSKITGIPYPWNKYDQVVVRDYVSGAMENTTASLYGEFVNQNFREIADKNFEDVVSHELFHQWFGDYATAESWSNITVNESFANYGEQLWRRYKYGPAWADKLQFDDLNKYLQYSKSSDPQLVRYYYEDKEKLFDPISYEKGGAILNYMHRLMGDQAFFKSMNVYLKKGALQSTEVSDWRKAVEEVTGQDWNWFFNQWYNRAGHPVLDVNYLYDDESQKLIVQVHQVQEDSFAAYNLPLRSLVITGAEKDTVNWNIQKALETYYYPYKNGNRPVVVPDYAHWLVGELKDNKETAGMLVQYKNCNDYINKYQCIAAAAKNLDDSASQAIIELALNDPLKGVKEIALNILSEVKKENLQKKWVAKVQLIAMNDGSNRARAAAFDVMSEWGTKSAKQSMIDALYDSSYLVAGAALDALYKVDSNKAYQSAKELSKTQPQGDLDATIWQVIGYSGRDEDILLYKHAAPTYYGTKKFQFVNGLYEYLKVVKNDVVFDDGVGIIAYMVNNENIKVYRMGLTSILVQLAKDYKAKAKEERGEERNHDRQRTELIRNYFQRIIDVEKDPENSKKYKTLFETIAEEGDVSK